MARGRLTAFCATHTSMSARSSGTLPLWIPHPRCPSLIQPLSGIPSPKICACPAIHVAPVMSWSCLSGHGRRTMSRLPVSQQQMTGHGGFAGGTRDLSPQTGFPRRVFLHPLLMRLFLFPPRLALPGVPRVRGRGTPRHLLWSCQRRVLGILGYCTRDPPYLWARIGKGLAHPVQGYPPNFLLGRSRRFQMSQFPLSRAWMQVRRDVTSPRTVRTRGNPRVRGSCTLLPHRVILRVARLSHLRR